MVLWDDTGEVLFFQGISLFQENKHFSHFSTNLFFIVASFKAISVQHVLKYLDDEGDEFKHMLK